jgi:nucleoside-diphosphate-sugar epimerase
MQQTWFITGSSRGFGRALTQAALDAGDRVVATARSPHTLDDLVDSRPEDLLAVALHVTDRAPGRPRPRGRDHRPDRQTAGHPFPPTPRRQRHGYGARLLRQQLDQAATWEQVSRSADFAEPYPAPFPTDGEASNAGLP